MYATAQRGTLAAVHPYTYDEERIRNELGTDQQPLPQYSYDELQAEQHQLRLPGQHEESIQQHQHFEGTTLTRGSTHARYPDRMLPPIQTLAPALQHQGSTQHTPQHQRRISSLSGQQPLQAYGAYQPQALAANYAVPQAGHLQYPSQQQHSYSTLRQIPQQRYDSLESSHSLLAPPPQQPQPQPHPHPHPQQQSAMVLPPPQLQQLTVNGLVAQSQHAAPLISNYLSHQQTRQMQQLNRTAHPAVQAAAAQAVAVAAANGFAVPLNYLNIANPSPSFAHFTANITQMPNQFYYQPVMYHQPGPLPIHPLAYQSALAAAYNTGMGSSVVPVNAAAAVAAAASASSVPFAPPLAASGARSQEWYEQALQVAHEKYNHGEYTTAYNMLLALYQTNQSHLPTLLLLGCTCYSLNLYQLSIQYNNLILQLDPNFAEAYSNLGTTYRAMAQNAHALQHVGGVSGTGTSAYNLSMAEQYYRMAISIRPKYWDASINLAGLQSANARYSEAIQVYANYERVMEEEYETNERFDLVALGQTESSGSGNKNDADFVTVLTSIEKQRKTRAIAEKASGRSVRGESSGWTDGRRRDLYYAKASLMYANGDVAGAKQEYLKGLVAIGLDLQPIYAQARTGSLPSSAVTPQQALVGLQQQQSLKGLKSNLDYNSTASAILQTMAKIYQDAHQMPLSVSFYYLALSICPNANTCNNIGILLSQHRLHEAIAWYEFGLSLEANHVHLLTNLGSALKDRGNVNEGITCYQRAIAIQPDFFIALANLANVYKDLGRVEESIDLYRRALKVKPDFVEAFCNYVNSLLFVCQWDGRDANLKRIFDIVHQQLGRSNASWKDEKKRLGAKSQTMTLMPKNVPTVLPFHTFTYATLTSHMVREISRRNASRVIYNVITSDWFPGFPNRPCDVKLTGHRDADKQLLERAMNYPYPYPTPPPPDPLIHIGYLSSDFNNHPLAHLMQSVFGMHDRSKFKVFCYALTPSDNSPYRAKIAQEADVFLDVSLWSIQQIIGKILEDGIHVLCNLNGYTKGGRNEVFAARAAPVQMQFMGFAGTMGSGGVWDPSNGDGEGEEGLGWAVDGFEMPTSYIQEVSDTEEKDWRDLPSMTLDAYETIDGTPSRFLDYLLTDEIATPRKFVVNEPLPYEFEPENECVGNDNMKLRERVRAEDDRGRIYTEAACYMPWTYFVNDHRQGFREDVDDVVERILFQSETVSQARQAQASKPQWLEPTVEQLFFGDDLGEMSLNASDGQAPAIIDGLSSSNAEQQKPIDGDDSDDDLTDDERLRWRREQIRRLKMRRELFPWLKEDAIIFACFNQLYKIDPDIFTTWCSILARLPNAILWLLRFPPAGESHLLRRAQTLFGASVASRVIFTDVAPKHLHIHRGRIADIFLDTPECNAHTTAADILWSGTPVVSFPKYDFKMCSRVCASIAYASGRWTDRDLDGLDGGAQSAMDIKRGIVLNGVERLKDPRLLGHWMVVNSYKEYEDLAVALGSGCRWKWKEIERFSQNSRWSRRNDDPPPPPAKTDAPIADLGVTRDPFWPSLNRCTHMYVPTTRTVLGRLRRRLFLGREKSALFDTPKWVRGLEAAFETAYKRWHSGWTEMKKRNALECGKVLLKRQNAVRDSLENLQLVVKGDTCEKVVFEQDVVGVGVRVPAWRRRETTRCLWVFDNDEGHLGDGKDVVEGTVRNGQWAGVKSSIYDRTVNQPNRAEEVNETQSATAKSAITLDLASGLTKAKETSSHSSSTSPNPPVRNSSLTDIAPMKSHSFPDLSFRRQPSWTEDGYKLTEDKKITGKRRMESESPVV